MENMIQYIYLIAISYGTILLSLYGRREILCTIKLKGLKPLYLFKEEMKDMKTLKEFVKKKEESWD